MRRGAGHDPARLFGLETRRDPGRREEAGQPEPGHGERVGGHGAEGDEDASGGSCRGRGRGAGTAGGRCGRRGRGSAAVASTEERTAPARPPSSGWAKATFGMQSRTWHASRSMSRKNGDAIRRGWTAEQTSWWNPGSVSSAVRRAAAGGLGALEDLHRQAGAGEDDGSGQAVRAGTDDDGVGHGRGS